MDRHPRRVAGHRPVERLPEEGRAAEVGGQVLVGVNGIPLQGGEPEPALLVRGVQQDVGSVRVDDTVEKRSTFT